MVRRQALFIVNWFRDLHARDLPGQHGARGDEKGNGLCRGGRKWSRSLRTTRQQRSASRSIYGETE